MLNQAWYRIACFFTAAFFISSAFSGSLEENVPDGWHPQWLHLLHYRPHGITNTLISQNDSEHFFLSSDGKHDPDAEMKAAVREFSKTGLPDNESAQCVFPARYHWLKQYYPAWQDQPCSKLDKWTGELNAHHLTLIFPASYLNSPSSMYGHTLVRLDREDENSSPLLAYSVNFAAEADRTDNELVFTYKGLAGGYPGVVSVLPYYAKVNEYSHLEYRDIWEYELNLTPEEVKQFVRHIWETQNTEFDYFFFDENCSYRLLGLLDASSERVNVTNDFRLMAVPVDTIRSLMNAGLVSEVSYRPSSATLMDQQLSELTAEQADIAKLAAQDENVLKQAEFLALSDKDKARVLETAVSYIRYLVVKKKNKTPEFRKRTLALLSARSRVPVTDSVFEEPAEPEIRDDQGHATHRMVFLAGASGDDSYAEIGARVAYHELTDLPGGYVPGAQIQMGDLRVRIIEGEARVQRFSVLDIVSLSPLSTFRKPLSWRVSAGWDRFGISDRDGIFPVIETGGGYSIGSPSHQLYAFAETRIAGGSEFREDYQWSGGAALGWLWQSSAVQWHLKGRWLPSLAGEESLYRQLSLSAGAGLSDTLQLKLEAGREIITSGEGNSGGTSVGAGLSWYF